MHLLEHEVVDHEPEEEQEVEQHAGRCVRPEGQQMVRHEGRQVERKHRSTGLVEEHLGVHAASRELTVLRASEVQLCREGAPRASGGEHRGEAKEQTQGAGAGQAGPATQAPPVPGEEPGGAGQDPQPDREQEHEQAVLPVLERLAGVSVPHMRWLSELARERGLRGLTVEVMSSIHEPPSTPAEPGAHHAAHPGSTVPAYICGDFSHGLADAERRVVHSDTELFVRSIPFM